MPNLISPLQTQSSTVTVWTIRSVVLVAFLDLFMQLPVVATYAAALGAPAALVGAIVGMYSAANLVGNLGAGALLDRLDRKLLIVAGMLLTAASLFAYGLVETPAQLLALRVFHGLSAGVLAPGAFAMLGDRTQRDHTRSMGLSGSLIAVSAVIGPPISGVISDEFGFGAVFATSGTLMLVAAALFAFKVPRPPGVHADRTDPSAKPRSMPTATLLVPIFLVLLVMTFGIGVLISHLPLTIEATGGSSRFAGVCFATFSVVASLLMASPFQRAVDGRSRGIALAGGLALLTGSGLILGIFGSRIGPTVPAMVVFGLGFGLLFPSLGAAVSQMTDSRHRGTAFGIFYAVYSLGVFLGAVVSGTVNEATAGTAGPFYVSAALALMVIPVAARIRGR